MIQDLLADAVRQALVACGAPDDVDVVLERPRVRAHGDWSTNAALVAAKRVGRPPRDLAGELRDRLAAAGVPHVESVEVAGPGFVNIHLGPGWLHDVLREVVTLGTGGYARPALGHGRRVNVEFVSANPTGPLHAGHGRGAAYGDAVARILERCGFEVGREYYLNDRGVQMEHFAASLAARAAGEEPPEDGYRGAYVTEWAAELEATLPEGAGLEDWLAAGEARAVREHRETLERFGVRFDVWFSERTLLVPGQDGRNAIDATLDDLRARQVAYDADGAVWLASTKYGDDKDRVLVKSDGEPTYLLPDIAYHRDKFARGFELLIDVWGADHHGYVPRMQAAMEALGHPRGTLECAIAQLVSLVRDGEPVRISKRSGDLITLAELLDDPDPVDPAAGGVGVDAARLVFLTQSVDTRQTIDLDLLRAQSMDNPVYYVQYAHARIASIARVAAERGVERLPLERVYLPGLVHPRELDVLRALAELPEVMELACTERAPHRLTAWVRDLAGAFHGFYHDCRVLGEDVSAELSQARLWLVEAARVGLAIGLDTLGVHAPDSM